MSASASVICPATSWQEADGFWQLDVQGRILYANEVYARLSGYGCDELHGMTVGELEAAEMAAETARRLRELAIRGAVSFESRHRRKDGSLCDVDVSVIRSQGGGGCFFALLRDIRLRRRAEALLKARLRLSEVGRGGNMARLAAEVVEAAKRLTCSAIGFFQFVEADLREGGSAVAGGQGDWPNSILPWGECLKQGHAVIYNDYAATGAHGFPPELSPIRRLLSVPVPGPRGFTAVIGIGNKGEDYDRDDVELVEELAIIAMDILNWARAEQARRTMAATLERTSRQWAAAMESFHGGIALVDGEHRLLRANAAFFALTGLPSGSAQVLKAEHCTSVSEVVAKASREGRAAERIVEADEAGNPSARPLEVLAVPFANDRGESDGMVLSLYDLTTARQQEWRLRQTVSQLIRSNAELERFGQVAAHDLQEPTRRQVLFAQLLQRRLAGRLDDDCQSYLEFIIAEARRMRDMVRALSLYDEACHAAAPMEKVRLDEVVADVLGTLGHEIDLSHAVVCVDDLEAVRGEPSRLHLLFVNLLSNALKFSRPERPPRIAVAAQGVESWLRVTVADNGIGIPEEYRANLFTLFRRLSPPGLSTGGTGMGLAQSRRIVEDLGGHIWVEDNDQGGTSVIFTLPRADGRI